MLSVWERIKNIREKPITFELTGLCIFLKFIVKALSKAYSESYQTTKTERSAKIVKGFYSLTNSTKCFNLDFWQGSGYASDCSLK